MFKATITAGIQFAAAKWDTVYPDIYLPKIRREIARNAGGYTELDTHGGWVDDEGELIEEAGKQWIVYFSTADRQQAIQEAVKLSEYIRDKLSQHSVVLEFGEAVVNFIEAESPVLINEELEVEYHE